MKGSRSSPSPDILIDRCLSPQLAKPLLRLCQLDVKTLAEVFGKEHSKTMPDTEWIEYCGANGVLALTANETIWKVPHEVRSILTHQAKVVTTKGQLSRMESAFVVGKNIGLLRRVMKQREPCFIQISSGKPTRRRLIP